MKEEMLQAVAYLYDIPKFTKKNPLEHTRNLMHLLGNPQDQFEIIHVAGSNGKGSVCNYLYHILLAAKKNTGLFTSPHLVDIRERFQVNGKLCETETFLEAFDRVRRIAEKLQEEGHGHPTFFEFVFAMGMLIFQKSGVEYVVLETGLGGRLDATNCIRQPALTVITSISLEHTEYLGDTIEQIAWEKAGIIKSGVPVVFDGIREDASEVIVKMAQKCQAPHYKFIENMCKINEFKNDFIDFSLFTDYDKETRWQIPAYAEYQVWNAGLAITAIRVLAAERGQDTDIDSRFIKQGLGNTRWPGRMQQVKPEMFLDGAHNSAGLEVFVKAVKRLCREDSYPPILLFSMLKEKDTLLAAEILTEHMEWYQIAVTEVPVERGVPYKELQGLFETATEDGLTVFGYQNYRQALQIIMKMKKPGQKVFCTGSLYFIGCLFECMDVNPLDAEQA